MPNTSPGGQGAGRSPGGQWDGRRPGGQGAVRSPGGQGAGMSPVVTMAARGLGDRQESRGIVPGPVLPTAAAVGSGY